MPSAGAGIGFLVGNAGCQAKKGLRAPVDEDFLDAEIAGTKEFNATTLAYNKKMAKDIKAIEKPIKKPTAQI